MRYIWAISLLLFVSGCIKKHEVSFTGTATGVKNGVFIVKTTDDSTIYGENINDGKFTLPKRQLRYMGYYLISIANSDSAKTLPPFEIYLEDGAYTVNTDKDKLYKYPVIISSSKTQAQLSAYYTLYDRMFDEEFAKSKQLNAKLEATRSSLSNEDEKALVNNVVKAGIDLNNIAFLALSEFAKNNPQSDISAHLMAKQKYESDPVAYYKLFKTFSNAAQTSEEGKELGDKLSKLSKLVIGAKAPAIYGNTLDGTPFDPAKITSKVILIDFWRADNEISRRNHQAMITFLQQENNPKTFGIVSVSIDTKIDWWTTAVHDDHMNWPQISDLKGDNSPNAANWGITEIPTYYLLNDKWEIVDHGFSFSQLGFLVDDYLGNHH